MSAVITTDPDIPLADQATYIWRRIARQTPATNPDRAAEITAVISAILTDDLPTIEPLDLDPETELGITIEALDELTDPMIAFGQCDTVTAAALDHLSPAALHAHPDLQDVAFAHVAQGLDDGATGCHFHDAILVGMKDGTAFILDYTFTQFGTDDAWPMATGPDTWVERLADATREPSPGAQWLATEPFAWGEPNEHRQQPPVAA